ncbi:MAG: hypothetical protein IIY58_02050, partial [Aeriscardovia sp.]|nr:hypothetical protein [Aeriscardovia sp.]
IQEPEFLMVAKNEEGETLAEGGFSFPVLYPGQEAAWSSLVLLDVEPASVEVVLKSPGKKKIVSVQALSHSDYVPLSVAEESLTELENKYSVSGLVVNENNFDISLGLVTIVFRDGDGRLMVGDHGFVNDVLGSSRTKFEFDIPAGLVGASYEIYAMPWYFRSVSAGETTTEVVEVSTEGTTEQQTLLSGETTTEMEERSEASTETTEEPKEVSTETTEEPKEASTETTEAPEKDREVSTETTQAPKDTKEASTETTTEEAGQVREEASSETTTWEAMETSTQSTTEASGETTTKAQEKKKNKK